MAESMAESDGRPSGDLAAHIDAAIDRAGSVSHALIDEAARTFGPVLIELEQRWGPVLGAIAAQTQPPQTQPHVPAAELRAASHSAPSADEPPDWLGLILALVSGHPADAPRGPAPPAPGRSTDRPGSGAPSRIEPPHPEEFPP